MSEAKFEREERYIVLKLSRLPKDEAEYLRDCHAGSMVDCVVLERDWPEYSFAWLMLEHRMAGKPVPDFNAVREVEALRGELAMALNVSAGREKARDIVQQRLADAERRNGELVELLREVVELPGVRSFRPRALWSKVDAALTKPEEAKS